jgi:hypothetical protein
MGQGKVFVDSVHSLGLSMNDVSGVRGLCVPRDLVRFSLLLYKLNISSVKDGGRSTGGKHSEWRIRFFGVPFIAHMGCLILHRFAELG